MKLAVLPMSFALLFSNLTVGQIYETRDAEGNPVFSDSPSPNAEAVELRQENIADSAEPQPKTDSPQTTTEKANERSRVIVIPDSHNEDVEAATKSGGRHEVLEGAERHEVMDAEQRREVREAEQRREVRDAEPRHEVGDFDNDR